jgi:hypothetical protein
MHPCAAATYRRREEGGQKKRKKKSATKWRLSAFFLFLLEDAESGSSFRGADVVVSSRNA